MFNMLVMQNINGRLLLVMDESGLDELSMTSQLHRRAFMEAIEHLKANGVRLATDLWEYKVFLYETDGD